MGVSLMVMGPYAHEINAQSLEPYTTMINREGSIETRLEHAEKWKEFYDLLFAFIAFAVSLL